MVVVVSLFIWFVVDAIIYKIFHYPSISHDIWAAEADSPIIIVGVVAAAVGLGYLVRFQWLAVALVFTLLGHLVTF